MNRLEEVSQLLVHRYKEDKTKTDYVSCVVKVCDSSWNHDFFVSQTKTKGNFRVKEIIPVQSTLPSFSTDIMLKGRQLVHTERTGLFKIIFSDDSFMYFAKWFVGVGRNRTVEGMFATEGVTWTKFLSLTKRAAIKKAKPKLGVYKLLVTSFGGVKYEEMKKIPNNPIYHNQLKTIQDNVNYYFEHVTDFMKYNQPGRRTMLLYGEPGTSKTSTLYKLALEHGKDKSVVFATNIGALFSHVSSCEKYNIPTLAFFEDCESAFGYNDSDVKNFLSGIHAKQNKGGTCIVYTTNYPEHIEDSIKERPERIDELHYIGPIEGTLLVECTKFYFGGFSPKEDLLAKVLIKPMTGAEVKLFVENTLKYCASLRSDITVDKMNTVLNNYGHDINKLRKFSEGRMGKTFAKSHMDKDNVGFATKKQIALEFDSH